MQHRALRTASRNTLISFKLLLPKKAFLLVAYTKEPADVNERKAGRVLYLDISFIDMQVLRYKFQPVQQDKNRTMQINSCE